MVFLLFPHWLLVLLIVVCNPSLCKGWHTENKKGTREFSIRNRHNVNHSKPGAGAWKGRLVTTLEVANEDFARVPWQNWFLSFDQAHYLHAVGNLGTQLNSKGKKRRKGSWRRSPKKIPPRWSGELCERWPWQHDIMTSCNWEALQAKAKVQAAQVGFVRCKLDTNWMQIGRPMADHDADQVLTCCVAAVFLAKAAAKKAVDSVKLSLQNCWRSLNLLQKQ